VIKSAKHTPNWGEQRDWRHVARVVAAIALLLAAVSRFDSPRSQLQSSIKGGRGQTTNHKIRLATAIKLIRAASIYGRGEAFLRGAGGRIRTVSMRECAEAEAQARNPVQA
jgi:hypothetical protein